MFTGIIKDIGKIVKIDNYENYKIFTVTTNLPLEEINIGDSISVNGACQTVISKSTNLFSFQTIKDTLACTNLSDLQYGDFVNLEPAMSIKDKLDGHLVSGHVDLKTKIIEIRKENQPLYLKFFMPQEAKIYVVPKGSIAIDGISLTIQEIGNKFIRVGLIDQTINTTTLKYKKQGDNVNIEFDMIGKYVIQYMNNLNLQNSNKDDILLEKLKQNGFI